MMEFNKKLQQLRKQKGLTQEELAEALYVSRTAISKWESGRGYPNIDSLKALARYFGVTIDELLSGEELLTIAEEDNKQKETRFRDLVFGLLDCSIAMFFFSAVLWTKSSRGGTGGLPNIPCRNSAIFDPRLLWHCDWNDWNGSPDTCPAKLPAGILAAE